MYSVVKDAAIAWTVAVALGYVSELLCIAVEPR